MEYAPIFSSARNASGLTNRAVGDSLPFTA